MCKQRQKSVVKHKKYSFKHWIITMIDQSYRVYSIHFMDAQLTTVRIMTATMALVACMVPMSDNVMTGGVA